jgi:UPF0042 nucleotide-binding protein
VTRKAKIHLLSFGFKYGQPATNFYFDVTFLPNPARMNGKQLFDELDDEMRNMILENKKSQELIARILDLILYVSDYDNLKVGIGCNSGRHRSVIIVNEISRQLNDLAISHEVSHRDLN